MEKGLVKIYFGEGKGKSTSSMGRALVCASEEKEDFVIQFLKGKMTGRLDYLKRLEPEIKVFRFEREEAFYEDLTEEEKRRFVRYFVCGCSISCMAKLENISENNMSVRISRLRDKIAQNISDNLSDGVAFDKKQKKFVRIDKKSPYNIKRDKEIGDRKQKGKE